MVAANSEQLKAIQHRGGVLLEAGAGSGKTFVLVEHIVFLVQEFIDENYHRLDEKDFRQNLSDYFSSIVLMTFTNKAAGELGARLARKFNDISKESQSYDKYNPWIVAEKALTYLNVSTIHGFCLKVLKEGHFASSPNDIQIVSERLIKKKVKQLFEFWALSLGHSESAYYKELKELFLVNESDILKSLEKIFEDPSLRLMWNKMSLEDIEGLSFNECLQSIIHIKGLSKLLKDPININAYKDKKKDPAWMVFLESFYQFTSSNPLASEKDYQTYLDFFASYKRLPAKPRSNLGLVEVEEVFLMIKTLRDLLRSTEKDFKAFFENRESAFSNWARTFKELFDFINQRYLNSPGLNFSDLEYYTYLGLQSEHGRKSVSNSYRYFIIDEFQDTSFLQFSIVEAILQGDYNRLFCVGDIKQAIYGFRGGDIRVFLDCRTKVPKVLNLKNNYRSKEYITKFNNSLFEYLFPKGQGFEGIEESPVPMGTQEVPIEDENKGLVKAVEVVHEYTAEDKLNTDAINNLEAQALCNLIKQIQLKSPGEQVAILYKVLTPTKSLIPLLIKNEMSFTCQIKIALESDPVIGLLDCLLNYLLEDKTEIQTNYAATIIQEFTQILGASNIDINGLVQNFVNDYKTMGLYNSYQKFFYSLGLANSSFENNMAEVETLSLLAKGDAGELWKILKDVRDHRYSTEFQFGSDPNSIIIMSSHASKGLEFDHVILAGIYTNGGSNSGSDGLLGKEPGSFKWKLSSEQKSAFKSPFYILEEAQQERMDFEESKRLFYVACTRPQKALYWIQLSEDLFKSPKNSWVWGLRKWQDAFFQNQSFSHIWSDNYKVELPPSESLKQKNRVQAPLFHTDPFGISKRSSAGNLLLVSELSVTRLASLGECPRKFYLQNICQFNDEDLKFFGEIIPQADEKLLKEETGLDLEVGQKRFYSSAARGTRLHEVISETINNQWITPRELKETIDNQGVFWVLDKLQSKKNQFDFISERAIKFSFFGHMISGTPDLVLMPKSSEICELWDFKTGNVKEDANAYWLQLSLYAYALYELGKIPKDQTIKLALAYIDPQEIQERELQWTTLEKELSDLWLNASRPHSVNINHCSSCTFQNLCSAQ